MQEQERDSHGPEDSSRDPSERGRLGFSRWMLSLIGVVIALAFLIWVFLP